ncbi:hypothetical protein VTL71DRAFT_12380 [Oculimacula yallundae]|uniref:non-specific serine/threonine protein kinase n=1 Tax=Oculimacula yallundae TaxID=86028 RepID=A0ABR4CMG9_9HELO
MLGITMANGRRISDQLKDKLREVYPELRVLPIEWKFFIDNQDEVGYWINSKEKKVKTRNHPKLGKLPDPWVFKVVEDLAGGSVKLAYYNKVTKEESREDPRFLPETLQNHQNLAKQIDGLEIASSLRRSTRAEPIEQMKRQPIGSTNIRSKYEIMHVLDDGKGSGGAMNGGVFVVRIKGQTRLSVEKRFKPGELNLGSRETEMLHRLKHGSISFYTAGFIDKNAKIGSVYVELCDRGSLQDVWERYQEHNMKARNDRDPDKIAHVPEGFLWHILIGLADGLAYLANGRSYVSPDIMDTKPADNWVPVVHRDIKPENVLCRSRDRIASRKYPYCVISDFGLATNDVEADHPKADRHHLDGYSCGTVPFYAPELCSKAYPNPFVTRQSDKFPPGEKHSNKSDLWAVGVCVFNLAMIGYPPKCSQPYWHINWPSPKGIDPLVWCKTRPSRIQELDIGDELGYTSELRKAIMLTTAFDPDDRPKSAELVQTLKKMVKAAGHDRMDVKQLPEWAFKVHDFHSAKPRPADF